MASTSRTTLRNVKENSQREYRSEFKTNAKLKLAILFAMSLIVAFGAIVACGPDDSTTSEQKTVRGQLTDVQAESFLDLNSITVAADDGRSYTLQGRGRQHTGFLPSHLREHMVAGEAVTVTFHEEDGALVLDSIED